MRNTKKSIYFEKRTGKWIGAMAAVLVLTIALTTGRAGTVDAALFGKGSEAYTESMEEFLAGLVPEEGLTIKGRTYNYWDVLSFLEEVRWAPDDYVHKDHHCALSDMPEEDVRTIVTFLRILMDCPKTYADYETVLKVQEALNAEGYDCGTVDGLLGELTYGALNRYQEDNDMRVINAVTDEVLEGLGLKEK